MKTLWILTGRMNAGGAESLIMEQLRHKNPEINIRLIIHSDSNDYSGIYDDEIKRLNIPISYIPSVGSIGIISYRNEFRKLVMNLGSPDIIHSHLNAVGGILAYTASFCGIKHRIIHCHADITYHGSWFNRIKSEICLSIMKCFVNHYGTEFWACSEAAARRLFYSWKKKVIIPNIIDVSRYLNNVEKRKKEREIIHARKGEIIIGAIGRIAQIKNYEIVLKAIADIVKTGQSIRFICYGRPVDIEYYKRLLNLTKELNIQNNVCFLGNCNRIDEAIAAFDIFVMPSISEGFGIAALEAQAAGLPCLLSTGIPNEVDMGLGLVRKINPHDHNRWTEEIISFRPALPKQIEIQMAISNKGYDSKTECEKIFKRYQEIINGSDK